MTMKRRNAIKIIGGASLSTLPVWSRVATASPESQVDVLAGVQCPGNAQLLPA